MNAQFQFIRQRPRSRGITLIECLVYIGALATVFGMGTAAFYHSSASSAALRRNADDIAQVLHVGERWRVDIRAATQPVRFDATEQILTSPTEKRLSPTSSQTTKSCAVPRLPRRGSSSCPAWLNRRWSPNPGPTSSAGGGSWN